MDLLQQTLELCKIYDIKPDKSKGQNFLVDEDVYQKIISSAELKKDDLVLEVGPGLGILTFKLASLVKKVLAVELDTKLVEVLNTLIIFKNKKNIKVFNNDILKLKQEKIASLGKYKIVTNLPYNITSIFLRKFLSADNKPESMILLLQKEVVQRIIAKPPKMSLLSLSVQFYAQAEIMFDVPASAFYPAPKVNSAVIKIIPQKAPLKTYEEQKKFFRLLKISFSSKRKMLKNNLSNTLKIDQVELENILKSLSLNSKSRAEQLSLADWLALYKKILAFL